MSAGWWTEADMAELDVLVYALLRDVREHRARCTDCASAGSGITCPRVDNAISVVIDWARFRSLLSRAEWLAAQRNIGDNLRPPGAYLGAYLAGA